MTNEPISLETLEAGNVVKRFNERLTEAGRILNKTRGKVKVVLEVEIKAEDGSFKCEAHSKVTLKAPGLAKAEGVTHIYLHDGELVPPAPVSKGNPIPFPHAKEG